MVGFEIARRDPLIDVGVVWLFSLLHDSQRVSDGADRGHGPRAADVTREAIAQGQIPGFEQYSARSCVLLEAIRFHTDGTTSDDISIGACWDADRLNLWRCAITPRLELMSTAVARRDFAELSAGARTLIGTNGPTWAGVEQLVTIGKTVELLGAPAA
jgi:uncharacterized protein